MNDLHFAGIPIVTNTALRSDEIYITDHRGSRTLVSESLTDEETEARKIADRLLNREGSLTLDMLQQAVDRFMTHSDRQPTSIIVSSATRRAYLRLLGSDRPTQVTYK